jgi:2-oxoglutarate dehydrogenase E1 component
LFEEFEGWPVAMTTDSDTGDVKYHMGFAAKIDVAGGGVVNVELMSNPSHLELVNPVAQGVARARQRAGGSAPNTRDEASVLPIVVHGDASFAGEGVVAETLNMSLLAGYRVGGTVHIITNNQVGFTTDAIDGRSTHYASDLAKGFEIPIVHVNADDAEGCVQAVRLAVAYRRRFGKDFLIDLVGYRRHGHNEADQPAFTQPLMYKVVATHPTAREIYAARLVRERMVTDDDVKAADAAVGARLQKIYSDMKHETPPTLSKPEAPRQAGGGRECETVVRPERLVALNEQLLAWPSTFKLHPTLQRTVPRRRGAINSGGIDWGHAEALAFASLLTEGVSVRLTGQDAERGTFSHRQAVLHDAETGEAFTPLAHLPQAGGEFEIYNSPLSETAVIGFEYGFSIAAPNELVLWEAQYGDFANVGQPIFDQLLSAGRAKWRHESGLVLLLPHGYEGQGPEHSSARLERFLQLCAEDNMVDARAVLPRPATPGAAPASAAARADAAQVAAASHRRALQARGSGRRLVPSGDRRSGRVAAARRGTAVGLLHREAVLRPDGCRGRASVERRLDSCRGNRAVAARGRRRGGPVSERGRSRVGARGAEEHGRVDLRSAASSGFDRHRDDVALHRPARAVEPGRWPQGGPRRGASSHREGRPDIFAGWPPEDSRRAVGRRGAHP